jgi:hypothetical protein
MNEVKACASKKKMKITNAGARNLRLKENRDGALSRPPIVDTKNKIKEVYEDVKKFHRNHTLGQVISAEREGLNF